MIFPYLYEIVDRQKALSAFFKLIIVWAFIQTISLFYELFEWGLTIVMSGDAAENYNGQQGDVWDPQKDMALAMLGSAIMFLLYLIYGIKQKRDNNL